MKTILVLFIIFVLDLGYCFAQKVTNISVEQLGQSIQVSYNLETELPCSVTLYYSTDNGTKWQGPLKKVDGDVGEKIMSGNKKIMWDVLNEVEQLKFDAVVFKVDARLMGLKEVKIGNQIWSAENLNVDRYSNGDIIPQVTDATTWLNLTTGAWCYYNNDSRNGPSYGKLYNWYAVADSRGLCPTGWHVPSAFEWNKLIRHCGGTLLTPGALKEVGVNHWASPNADGKNSVGFTALPGGGRNHSGFFELKNRAYFWSSSKLSKYFNGHIRALFAYKYAQSRGLCYFNSAVIIFPSIKSDGQSVRCIKD